MTELKNSAPNETAVGKNPYQSDNEPSYLLDRFRVPSNVETSAHLQDQQLAEKLQTEFSNTKNAFEKNVAKQGFIGETFDWMKEHLGASASASSGLLKRGWSNVLNYDDSSTAIRENLTNTEFKLHNFSINPSAENLAKNLKDEIQVDADGQTFLKIQTKSQTYDRSQNEGVNEIANAAVLGLSLVKAGEASSLVKSALLGAGTKTALKAADGAYSTPIDDALTGGVLGLTGHAARLGGNASDNLIQRLEENGFTHRYGALNSLSKSPRGLSAFRSGSEFAPVGALTAMSATYSNSRYDGKSRLDAVAKSFDAAPRGAVEGFAVGALFGALHFKTPEAPDSPSPPPPPPLNPQPFRGGSDGTAQAARSTGTPHSPSPLIPAYHADIARGMTTAGKQEQLKFPFTEAPPPESFATEPERIFVNEEALKVHPIFKRVSDMTETEQLQVAREKQVSPTLLNDLSQSGITEVKAAVARNPGASTLTLTRLAGDLYPSVREAVAESTKATEQILSTLAKDSQVSVRTAVARNHNSDLDTLERLAKDHQHGVSQAALKTLYDGGDLPLPSQLR